MNCTVLLLNRQILPLTGFPWFLGERGERAKKEKRAGGRLCDRLVFFLPVPSKCRET